MKEGINLAQPYQKPIISTEKLSFFKSGLKPLTRIALLLGILLVLTLLINFFLGLYQNRQQSQKAKLNHQLDNLKEQAQVVLTAVHNQKDLDFIKGQRKNFLPLLNLVKDNLPQDTNLTDIDLSESQIEVSAQTPTGNSFSQFVGNLIKTNLCQDLSLTRSAYVQLYHSYSFTLQCLLKSSTNK